jgi:hypothetical protein
MNTIQPVWHTVIAIEEITILKLEQELHILDVTFQLTSFNHVGVVDVILENLVGFWVENDILFVVRIGNAHKVPDLTLFIYIARFSIQLVAAVDLEAVTDSVIKFKPRAVLWDLRRSTAKTSLRIWHFRHHPCPYLCLCLCRRQRWHIVRGQL